MNNINFATLLQEAVSKPGIVSSAFRQFHNYSLGNQILAFVQCLERGLTPGPIATFNKWKELGRYVKKGSKAIVLCMPITMKHEVETENGIEEIPFQRFVFRPNWFVLSQTDGKGAIPEAPVNEWDREKALSTLGITEIPFDLLNGNVLGYARGKELAINPVNPTPVRTLLHEIAHIVLGHTATEEHTDSTVLPRTVKELEAEGVAMLCCAALDIPGIEESRGYIQGWYGFQPIDEKIAQRIFKTADKILKAGM